MVPDMGDIPAHHSSPIIPTMTEAAVFKCTLHAPHLATTAAHAAPQLMDAAITTHAETPTGIVAPILYSPLLP